MSVGSEWLVDAAGCDAEALTSVAVLRVLFERIIRELDLHPLHDPQFHVFPDPGGVTGFVMLSESHLACHTYPEFGTITLNLYCCKPRPDWPWREQLGDLLGASSVAVRQFSRATTAGDEVRAWP